MAPKNEQTAKPDKAESPRRSVTGAHQKITHDLADRLRQDGLNQPNCLLAYELPSTFLSRVAVVVVSLLMTTSSKPSIMPENHYPAESDH
jgi:hypothetical protein